MWRWGRREELLWIYYKILFLHFFGYTRKLISKQFFIQNSTILPINWEARLGNPSAELSHLILMIHLLLQVGVGIIFYAPNHGYIIDYFHWEYSWFSSIFPRKFRDTVQYRRTRRKHKCHFFTTNSTWHDLASNSGRSCGKLEKIFHKL